MLSPTLRVLVEMARCSVQGAAGTPPQRREHFVRAEKLRVPSYLHLRLFTAVRGVASQVMHNIFTCSIFLLLTVLIRHFNR